MTMAPDAPVVLVILDGWGYREESRGNAIAKAATPVIDSLWQTYPSTLINTSGKAVGLPQGQMGNSEVGHLNIGAGRTVPQELVRIADAIEDGSLFKNPALVETCASVAQRGKTLHLIGLCSQGGVHAHVNHLFALLELAKQHDIQDVCIHAIMDGRDTPPTHGKQDIQRLQAEIAHVGLGRIVTLSGRYFAMDRDRRWDRIQQAYEVMTQNTFSVPRDWSPIDVIADAYDHEISDEFLPPTRIAPGAIEEGDGVIFFNFRPDRARQLVQAFVDPEFDGFQRTYLPHLEFVTFTQYDASLPVKIAFKPQNLDRILGEVISEAGLKQLRLAETEKYAHVTYFFNGGIEDPFPGEDRLLVSSPMVPTYDQVPEMSAVEVTDKAIASISKGVYSLVVINYANTDMVGHTGKMDATVEAIEAVDTCLGRLIEAVGQVGGTMLITADHGNAELMFDEQGNPWTAHTTNPVPFILVEGEKCKIPGYGTEVPLRADGCLADIAPTILEILGLPIPDEMTGKSMFQPLELELRASRDPVGVHL